MKLIFILLFSSLSLFTQKAFHDEEILHSKKILNTKKELIDDEPIIPRPQLDETRTLKLEIDSFFSEKQIQFKVFMEIASMRNRFEKIPLRNYFVAVYKNGKRISSIDDIIRNSYSVPGNGNYEIFISTYYDGKNYSIRKSFTVDLEIIDFLKYKYLRGRLISVSDHIKSEKWDFDFDTQGKNQYSYDLSGNVIKDLNRGIQSISYTRHNLPKKVTLVNGTYYEYTYNNSGQRLIKKRNGVIISHYIRNSSGQILAELDGNGAIKYKSILGTGEILGKSENISGNYSDHYYLKDHLGNIRVTIKNNLLLSTGPRIQGVRNSDGSITISGEHLFEPELVISAQTILEGEEAEVVSAQDYYPYGMVSRSSTSITEEQNKFKYQGKERDLETGYDYFEARFYDSSIGRFLQVDPMAENFHYSSPFVAMNNNPITLIDPTGMYSVDPGGLDSWLAPVDDYYYNQSGQLVDHVKNNKPDKFFVEVKQEHTGSVEHNGKQYLEANSDQTVKGAQGKGGFNKVNEGFENSTQHKKLLATGTDAAKEGISSIIEASSGDLSKSGRLDPKRKLDKKTLNVIDNKVYNQDETGNHIWGASLEAAGIPDFIKTLGAEAYSIMKKGKFDEANDKKAYLKGSEWQRNQEKKKEEE
jgi:RHS repeat-associated protein